MILARISKAIREQNWFAVVLEFVIVIAGVVIGFQVTAWNAERAQRSQEADLLARLHDDLLVLEIGRSQEFDRFTDGADTLRSAEIVIFGQEEERDNLTEQECAAIGWHHVVVPPPDELPTLEELLAAGRIELIGDEDVRHRARFYAQRRSFHRGRNTIFLAHIQPLGPAFANAVRASLEPSPDETEGGSFIQKFTCRLDEMRGNAHFQTAFAVNFSAYQQITASREQLDADLDALHYALDTALDIEHEELAP